MLVFPDLNTGNNTYKAVQRSAGATAVGPGAAGPQQAGQRPVPRGHGRRHRHHRGRHRGPGADAGAGRAPQAGPPRRPRRSSGERPRGQRRLVVGQVRPGRAGRRRAPRRGRAGPAAVLARGLVERVGTSEARLRHTVTGQDGRPDDETDRPTSRPTTTPRPWPRWPTPSTGTAPTSARTCMAVGPPRRPRRREFSGPVLVDDAVLEEIDRLSVLAPLHNPVNLAGLRAARERFADVPHVAVFDTAFHADLPAVARTYAVPRDVARGARGAPLRLPRHLARLRLPHGRRLAGAPSAASTRRPPGSSCCTWATGPARARSSAGAASTPRWG